MIFSWFSSRASARFGRELATFVLSELSASTARKDTKFTAKAEKALIRADRRVREFTAGERMNVYKKAKLANAFLWTLKDSGCPPDYATQLTEWLSLRL
jgi:hypothetical protein